MHKTCYCRKTIFFVLFTLYFVKLTWSQVPIVTQGFDGTGTWTYTSTHTNGASFVDTATSYMTPNSLGLDNYWNDNSNTTFATIDISAYTGVAFSIAYASFGEADDNDDLFLDYHYFDGGAWVNTTIKLIDGQNSTTTDVFPFGTPGNAGATTNPFTVSVPDSATNFYAVIRGTYIDNSDGDHDNYYIDDVILSATLPPDPIPVDDNVTIIKNSTTGVANQIDVSTNDSLGSEGGGSDNYALNTTASSGTITEVSDGIFEYVPNTGFLGTDSFTYNICDISLDCATATVNVNVNLGACEPVSNSSATHYITNVFLTGETTNINNASGDDGGYGDYTPVPAADLIRGSSYPIELSVSTNMATQNRSGWAVYIDLNQDGVFDPVTEMVWDTLNAPPTGNGEDQSLSSSDNTFDPGTINIPASASLGLTIMRIGARQYWYSSNPCGETSNPEEFEDYVVNIQNNATAQDLDLSGNGSIILSGSTITSQDNYTDFGFYDINSGAVERRFVITNNGISDLTLTAPYVAVSGSATFTVSDLPNNNVIAPGNSETFTITFDPSAIGNFSATVTITSDDSIDPIYTFVVDGEGAQTFPDTDGDSIPDNLDLDDDNDGLLDSYEDAICNSYSASTTTEVVFLNETFGSGTNRIQINGNTAGSSTTYCFEDGTGSCPSSYEPTSINDSDYTVHYIVTNNNNVDDGIQTDISAWAENYWYAGEDHTPGDTNGRMAIFNATADPGVFYSQTITGVNTDVPIRFGFYVINLDRTDAPCLNGTGNDENGNPCSGTREKPEVEIRIYDPNGLEIAYETSGLINPTSPAGDWIEVNASFTTSYPQFTIELSNANFGGLGNDLAIDDIFVKQTLCDLDGDGVADSLDLDNDNDGIPNIVELGLADLDKDATLYGTGWVDTNSNGVHDLYEAGATPIDSDGDGTPNYLDSDSDNDGIFDTVEYDSFGDIDVNGDGVGDGLDSISGLDNDGFDGDGILSIMDTNDIDANSNDYGTTGYTDPLDSDADAIPDYLDPFNDTTGVYDIDTTIYGAFDTNNDGIIDGTTDIDFDGILDTFDTNTSVFGSPRDLNDKYTLFFDGRNDYVEEPSVINAWVNSTLMAWIKIETGSSGNRFIVGQNNFNLMVNNTGNLTALANGYTLQSAALPIGVWVHVAASYSCSNNLFSIYVNGQEIGTNTSVSGNLSAGTSSLTIGRSPDTNSAYFEGEIDEVRVFNEALTTGQIQQMVYQELGTTFNFKTGTIIPIEISASISASLIRYFKMDGYKDDILDDKTTASIDLVTGAKIYNIKNIYFQTAPLPYETSSDGDWSNKSTWLHGDVWDINDETTNQDWSIVHVKNNITTSNRHSTLGLIIDDNVKLEVNNDVELINTLYLSLNGKIDLQGESQLIQTQNSTLLAGVNGSLERDQQGTVNLYTYNYWSSPVHNINPNIDIDGDEKYTIASVLKDGEDPLNPAVIDFISGYDGNNSTSPIQISDYWIWKFNNHLSGSYSDWQQVTSVGELLVGEGYTMKGPGTGLVTSDKNYVFEGIPNNGEIVLPTTAGNDYLVGNPYPSAIDGAEFLNDNPHLDGTLYFWEHYGGNSHNLSEYQGGYGLYNFSGGTPALDGTIATPDPGVSQTGIATKTPKRYIPVGQGFFVNATTTGNTKFENDQRIFVTEAGNINSVFFKNSNTKNSKTSNSNLEDLRPKIRINYKSPKGYVRQLLTTIDEKATINYDRGFDGLLIENNAEDMYWTIGNNNYIIQGIDAPTENTILPLTVKTNISGIIEINIASLEHVSDNFELYLKDKTNNTYHNLIESTYMTTVEAGETNDRFEIVFASSLLSTKETDIKNSLNLFYNPTNASVIITNSKNQKIDKLIGRNMLGQNIFEKDFNSTQNQITVPVNLATGVYIFSIETQNSKISKKMIINK